jgi:uncharacterized protein (DUF1330 family)
VAQEPSDLKDIIRRWYRIRENRLWVMNFVNFTTPAAQAQYKEHLSTAKQNHDLKLHLFSKSKDLEKDTEPFMHFSLISFPSERAYRKYLVSDEYKKLVGDDSSVKEGMVLTTELRLPPKSRAINPNEWEYRNPHQPYGEDWFR